MLTSRGLTRILRSAKKALSSAKRTNALFLSAAYLSRASLPSASYTTSNTRPAGATQQQASEYSLERIWNGSLRINSRLTARSYATEVPGAIGHVKTVVGAVVDLQFETESLPPILSALEVQDFHGGLLVLKVAAQARTQPLDGATGYYYWR